MSAQRFEGNERALGRPTVAAVLVATSAAWPLGPALSISSGAVSRTHAVLAIWAIGAAPGLLIAALASLRARLGRVVTGLALLQGVAMLVAFMVVWTVGGGGQ